MECVVKASDGVVKVTNNVQKSPQLFTVGDGWNPEARTAWILCRLAVNVLGIKEEELFEQLSKQTNRLKNWCPLHREEKNATDKQLKFEVTKEIEDCKDLTKKINEWITEITLKSVNLNNTLQITLDRVHSDYFKDILNSHFFDRDKNVIIDNNTLLLKAINRAKADNKQESSEMSIDTLIRTHDISKSQIQNKKLLYNNEKELLKSAIESYHENTEEFEKLESDLRSELQKLKTAQTNLKTLFNPLYEKIHPTEGLSYWSSIPDHLNLCKGTDSFSNLKDESIGNIKVAIDSEAEIKDQIRSSSIFKRLKEIDSTDEYKKFMKVFKGKLDEASIDIDDTKKVMVHVYYWEKMPETSKKMRDHTLKGEAKNLIRLASCVDDPQNELKSIWTELITDTEKVMEGYEGKDLDSKKKCLVDVQALFLKISKETIDPYYERVEKIKEQFKVFFDELIERPIREKISSHSLNLFSNIFMITEKNLQVHITDIVPLKQKLSNLQNELSKASALLYNNLESYKKEYLQKSKDLDAVLPKPENSNPNVYPIAQTNENYQKWDKEKPEIDLIALKAFIMLDFAERVLGLSETEIIPSGSLLSQIDRLKHWRPLFGAKQKREDKELKNHCSIVISQITTLEESLKKWRNEISKIEKKVKETSVAKDLYFYPLAAIQKGYLQLMRDHHNLLSSGIDNLIKSLDNRIQSAEKCSLYPKDVSCLVKRFDANKKEMDEHADSISTHTQIFKNLKEIILSKKSCFENIKYVLWSEKLGATSLFEKEFNDLYDLLNNAEFPEGLLSHHENNNSSEKPNPIQHIDIEEKHLGKDSLDLKPDSHPDEIGQPKIKRAHLVIKTNPKSKEYTPNTSKILKAMTSKIAVRDSDNEEKIAKIKEGPLYKILQTNEEFFNEFYQVVESLKNVLQSQPSFLAANVDEYVRCYQEMQCLEKIPEKLQVETAIAMKAKVQEILAHINSISISVALWTNEINQYSNPLHEDTQYNDASLGAIDLGKLREYQVAFDKISKERLQSVLGSIEDVKQWLGERTNADSQLKLSEQGEKFVITFFDQTLTGLQQLDQSFELDNVDFNKSKLSLPVEFAKMETILVNFESTFNAAFWNFLYPNGGVSAYIQSCCINPLKTPNILESYPVKNSTI